MARVVKLGGYERLVLRQKMPDGKTITRKLAPVLSGVDGTDYKAKERNALLRWVAAGESWEETFGGLTLDRASDMLRKLEYIEDKG